MNLKIIHNKRKRNKAFEFLNKLKNDLKVLPINKEKHFNLMKRRNSFSHSILRNLNNSKKILNELSKKKSSQSLKKLIKSDFYKDSISIKSKKEISKNRKRLKMKNDLLSKKSFSCLSQKIKKENFIVHSTERKKDTKIINSFIKFDISKNPKMINKIIINMENKSFDNEESNFTKVLI